MIASMICYSMKPFGEQIFKLLSDKRSFLYSDSLKDTRDHNLTYIIDQCKSTDYSNLAAKCKSNLVEYCLNYIMLLHLCSRVKEWLRNQNEFSMKGMMISSLKLID